MIGYLYRYPHPHDSTRFIYVGQGAKRDQAHRSGKSSFGKRFKKLFPNAELPCPVREQAEVKNWLELNEEETIWMFRYHTWRGYQDGMNLIFPGSTDYKIMGKIGGPTAGSNAKKFGLGFFASGMASKGGRIGGKSHAKSGHCARIARIGGLAGGRIGGGKNIASGHLERLRTSEHQKKASEIALHTHWHIDRNKSNPRCAFCSEQSLIVAYA